VQAILLAAGQATRLRPLTDDRPKCLLEVAGETILGRAVRILVERGVDRLTVVDGYRGDMIRQALASSHPDLDVRYVRNHEYTTTNNAWSLLLAGAAIDGAAGKDLLLLDADIVFAPAVIDRLLAHPAPNRLGLRTGGTLGAEEMKARLGPGGLVVELSKDISPRIAAGESVGIEVFGPALVADLFAILRARHAAGLLRDEYYEAAFVAAIASGHAIAAVDFGDLACHEIDTADDLAAARREFAGS
jgi:choline kinase